MTEKFFILAYYDGRATGNLEKAEQTCGVWVQTYPRERLPHTFLAGFIYLASGRYEKSIEESQKVIEIDPDSVFPYAVLASDYVALERMEDAENAIAMGTARKLDSPQFTALRYDMAFSKGMPAEWSAKSAWRSRPGRRSPDREPRGVCAGIYRTLATGEADVAQRHGRSSTGSAPGKSWHI